ncbi:MAG TPA: DUF4097 family beta strand repeat-containing protein [Longimicrobiales bacterium]|nr:DUF4097 family beta strand repeat-containing protein [Longimicrobiales bacterium]
MRTLPLIALLALAATPLAAQRSTERFTWHGRIPAGQEVEIRGINGGIRAEPGSGPEVEVVAEKSGRRSDPREVRIDVVPHSGGVTLCAVYPAPSGREPNECRPGGGGRSETRNNDVQVEWVVRVPAGVDFVGRTVNGDADARDLRGDVDLATVNGGVSISTSGLARASTVNGSVDVSMGRTDWTGRLEFQTVNGGIDLTLPADLSAEVTASTVNGGISTDFPLTISGRFSPRRIQGTVGTGGRDLALKTVNGGIELRRR